MIAKRLFLLMASVCLVLILAASFASAQEKPIELGWVSFLPATFNEPTAVREHFVNKVNERAKGELVIKWRGGPEVFGAGDIGPAVQKGVADIGMVFVGAYEPIVGGVGGAMLTQLTLDEERRPGGAYDYLLGMHKKAGLYYLGRGFHTGTGFFYCWLRNKRVEKREDLARLRIGSTAAGRPAAVAWGATWVNVATPENYTAMERGVVDAINSHPPSTWKSQRNYEVSKYVIDHPYYACTLSLFMNLDSFNRLPKHLQNLLMETFIEAEKDIMKRAAKIQDDAKRFMVDKGLIEPIKFSPANAKWYLEAAYNGAWDYQQKRFPKVTPILRELLTK